MTTSSEAASSHDLDAPGARGGVEADIEAVYRSAYPRFLRVAQAITGDVESGHDAVQEGFARALRGRRGLRRASALEPWLWRAVVNVARDRRRADERRRRREVGADPLSGLAAAPESPAPDAAVIAAIGALPERQRLVLFLRYYADLDHRGIATALGIRPGTVGAALHTAHRSVRSRLEEGAG
jgi:RNA polymerase sigma factor (sigma-70 family)